MFRSAKMSCNPYKDIITDNLIEVREEGVTGMNWTRGLGDSGSELV